MCARPGSPTHDFAAHHFPPLPPPDHRYLPLYLPLHRRVHTDSAPARNGRRALSVSLLLDQITMGHPREPTMPKRSARKPSDVEWRAFINALAKFKKDGTGSRIDHELLSQFPLFHGKAPPGHPYPQAFTEPPTDEVYCFVQPMEEDLILLSRRLPSGRVISIDTCEFAMLNGGVGIAHINMDNGDNRIENLTYVTEAKARRMLAEYVEPSDRMRPAESLNRAECVCG